MLDVHLTISDNNKAAKLLDLLKELQFVEIVSCKEISSHDVDHLIAIFQQWKSQSDHSGRVIQQVSSQVNVSVASSIYDTVVKDYGWERLLPVFAQLAAEPKSSDTIEIPVGEGAIYCRYLNGFRVLHTYGIMSWPRMPSMSIFHIVKLP